MKKFLFMLMCCVLMLGASCNNNKSQIEKEAKEYIKFQKDSLKLCTATPRLAESAVLGAFDRVPENNGYYKKDKVELNYNDSLGCWIGKVIYHVDRNNTYYQSEKTFYVKYWCEGNSPETLVQYYTVSENPPAVVTDSIE